MTTPKLIRSYLKLEIDYLLDKICLTSTKQKKIIRRHTLHILVSTSVLHRMTWIDHARFSQFMEWQNLDIRTLKHATYASNTFWKLLKNQITTDFIYLVSSNFVTISHINYWDQVNSWKNLLKFWNGPLCKNKSGTFPQLNVTVYWKCSATEACAKKLSQILANNIENGGRGIGLRIYMRYCKLYYLSIAITNDTSPAYMGCSMTRK